MAQEGGEAGAESREEKHHGGHPDRSLARRRHAGELRGRISKFAKRSEAAVLGAEESTKLQQTLNTEGHRLRVS